jgi:hypothetical protein
LPQRGVAGGESSPVTMRAWRVSYALSATIAQGFFLYGIVWTEEERKKGHAWGVKTVESFHTYGTPPDL